jgi:hypothetical protein
VGLGVDSDLDSSFASLQRNSKNKQPQRRYLVASPYGLRFAFGRVEEGFWVMAFISRLKPGFTQRQLQQQRQVRRLAGRRFTFPPFAKNAKDGALGLRHASEAGGTASAPPKLRNKATTRSEASGA